MKKFRVLEKFINLKKTRIMKAYNAYDKSYDNQKS